ncbi:MAG: type VI secretion system ATPase TssH, partial [Oscillospiraceae bacterium]|nr:type VI secretion system ATPase TssH [Oscillospiraceae bacterium]
NLGSAFILEGIDDDGNLTDEARSTVEAMLKQQFRPEFLNRLDEIVFYKPLSRGEITSIVDLMLADLNRRLADKELTMEVTDAAKEFIVEQGYDPVYGARPLRRYIQHSLETMVGRLIIGGTLLPETTLLVGAGDDGLTVEPKR